MLRAPELAMGGAASGGIGAHDERVSGVRGRPARRRGAVSGGCHDHGVIDGDVVDVIDGGVNQTYDLGDPTEPHSYEVFVDGAGSDEFDRTFSDSVEACEQPTQNTSPPETTNPPETSGPPVTTAHPATTDPSTTTPATPVAPAGPPAPPAPPAASSQGATLPATGSTSTGLVIAAAATLSAGATMWFVSRRRRTV